MHLLMIMIYNQWWDVPVPYRFPPAYGTATFLYRYKTIEIPNRQTILC